MSALPGSPFVLLAPNETIPTCLRHACETARSRRVTFLIVAMTMMGIADLMCTLTYMRTSGMLEANPLARFILTTGAVDGGSEQLVMFKALTILLSCGTLYIARRHRQAELSAWVCTAMMCVLTIHWINYNRSVSAFTNDMAVLAMSGGEFEPMWVKLED
ncbi:MAG: hypothetical protein JNK58_10565 [Phycisphaerae bacterium]|nr:hypothetical protein [Phycisphaerae bacterium]